MPADADAKCCCAWGAAIGARGLGVRYAEYPEFGCAKCPVHQAALGETELCRRHKKEDQSMEISDRWCAMYESTVALNILKKKLQGVLEEYALGGWRVVTLIDTFLNGTSMGVYNIVFERNYAVTR